MALRYSLGLATVADKIDEAVARVLAAGARTRDIAVSGTNAVGTSDMGDAIVKELGALLR